MLVQAAPLLIGRCRAQQPGLAGYPADEAADGNGEAIEAEILRRGPELRLGHRGRLTPTSTNIVEITQNDSDVRNFPLAHHVSRACEQG